MKNKNLKEKMKMIGAGVLTGNFLIGQTEAIMAAESASSSTISTGITQVDAILLTLKTLFLGLVAGIGLIILIKGIADTAQAYQQQDSRGIYDGAKGIAAGAIMVFAGTLLTLMGL